MTRFGERSDNPDSYCAIRPACCPTHDAALRMKEALELLLHYWDTDHPDEDLHAAFAEARALLREIEGKE